MAWAFIAGGARVCEGRSVQGTAAIFGVRADAPSDAWRASAARAGGQGKLREGASGAGRGHGSSSANRSVGARLQRARDGVGVCDVKRSGGDSSRMESRERLPARGRRRRLRDGKGNGGKTVARRLRLTSGPRVRRPSSAREWSGRPVDPGGPWLRFPARDAHVRRRGAGCCLCWRWAGPRPADKGPAVGLKGWKAELGQKGRKRRELGLHWLC